MKNLIFVFSTFLALVGIQSCDSSSFEQVVTIDIPAHTSKLALSSSLHNIDTVLRVFTGQSVSILDVTTSQIASGAQVQLLKNGTSLGTFLPQGDGWQTLKIPAPLGEDRAAVYTLKATANGFTEVKSTQIMPVLVPIKTAKLVIDTTQEMGHGGGGGPDGGGGKRIEDKITLDFQDPAGSVEYYAVNVFLVVTNPDGTFAVQDVRHIRTQDPIAEEVGNEILLAGTSFDGKPYSLNCTTRIRKQDIPIGSSAKFYVVLESITKDEYFYKKAVASYEQARENPFAEPVIVRTNIENGYGFFGLRAVSKFEFQL